MFAHRHTVHLIEGPATNEVRRGRSSDLSTPRSSGPSPQITSGRKDRAHSCTTGLCLESWRLNIETLVLLKTAVVPCTYDRSLSSRWCFGAESPLDRGVERSLERPLLTSFVAGAASAPRRPSLLQSSRRCQPRIQHARAAAGGGHPGRRAAGEPSSAGTARAAPAQPWLNFAQPG